MAWSPVSAPSSGWTAISPLGEDLTEYLVDENSNYIVTENGERIILTPFAGEFEWNDLGSPASSWSDILGP